MDRQAAAGRRAALIRVQQRLVGHPVAAHSRPWQPALPSRAEDAVGRHVCSSMRERV